MKKLQNLTLGLGLCLIQELHSLEQKSMMERTDWQKTLLDITSHKSLPCSCSEEGGTGTVSVYAEVGASAFSGIKFILL